MHVIRLLQPQSLLVYTSLEYGGILKTIEAKAQRYDRGPVAAQCSRLSAPSKTDGKNGPLRCEVAL